MGPDYKWFMYVRYSEGSFRKEPAVFATENEDVYHSMGELQARSNAPIERIDFCEYTEEKRAYWESLSVPIRHWRDTHDNRGGRL